MESVRRFHLDPLPPPVPKENLWGYEWHRFIYGSLCPSFHPTNRVKALKKTGNTLSGECHPTSANSKGFSHLDLDIMTAAAERQKYWVFRKHGLRRGKVRDRMTLSRRGGLG